MTEAAASMRPDLNKTQTNTIFISSRQMEVSKDMLVQLGKEGIKEVEDLAEFSKEIWKQVAENLKCLGGQMKNLEKKKDNNNPSTIPQTLYLFGVRTQKRLLKASELKRYYEMVGHRLTVLNTVYKTVIRSFTNQWASLKDCKRQTQPMVSNITGELPIMQWVDVFDDFLNRKICVRTIPLSYVTREIALALIPASVHSENLYHVEEFESIEDDL
eukprot:11296599-Ditylum_brightwellii.AAC.1